MVSPGLFKSNPPPLDLIGPPPVMCSFFFEVDVVIFKTLINAILILFLTSTAYAQDENSVRSIWSDINTYVKDNSSNPTKTQSVLDHLDVIEKNASNIKNYPSTDQSSYIDSIIQTFNQLSNKVLIQNNEYNANIKAGIQQALFVNTVSPLLLGQTSKAKTDELFKVFFFNMINEESNKIELDDIGFSSLVISKESENYIVLKATTKIPNLAGAQLDKGEYQLFGIGGVIIESSSGQTIFEPIQVAQSVKNKDDSVLSLFSGRVLGKNLDLNKEYHVSKVVLIFENEKGESIYKVKSVNKKPATTLKAIDSGLIDFISNSEYAISYDKFQDALAKDNIVPFEAGESFTTRSGEHSLGVIIWREQGMFAFYRCHNDNYSEKLINAENCWIIRAPRKYMPADINQRRYLNYGIYNIIDVNDKMTNLDFILNKVTGKLNRGQELLFANGDKIYANTEEQIKALKHTGSYQNHLSGFYDEHAVMFEKTMKYAYYFTAAASAGAMVEYSVGKLINKLRGYKPDDRFRPKLHGQLNPFSLQSVYKTTLKYGTAIFGGTLALYTLNRSMDKYDESMLNKENSLDLILSMSDEFKKYPDEQEYFIQANRNYVDVIHAAIISSLEDYNELEQYDAFRVPKKICKEVSGYNCEGEAIDNHNSGGA